MEITFGLHEYMARVEKEVHDNIGMKGGKVIAAVMIGHTEVAPDNRTPYWERVFAVMIQFGPVQKTFDYAVTLVRINSDGESDHDRLRPGLERMYAWAYYGDVISKAGQED